MFTYKSFKRVGSIIGMASLLLLVVLVGTLGFVSVTAATGIEEKGFVEYHTEASINFTEVIEVQLTDKQKGYCYTHSLYRANDYFANISIPLGEYTVSAKVVSNKGLKTDNYDVVYLGEDIVIDSTNIAIPIRLRVDIVTGIETSPNDYLINEESSVESTVSEPSSDIVSEEVTDTMSAADTNEVQQSKDGSSSLLLSFLFYIGILLLIVVAYWLYKRYLNKDDEN